MLVECLIMRDGPTFWEKDRTKYVFTPVPDPNRRKGEPSTSICEVNSEEHLNAMLRSKQYRPYVAGQLPPEAAEAAVNLSGFSIIKHQDGRTEGYRVETLDAKPKMYAGSDGIWRPDTKGLVPFDSELSAWQWLKDEVKDNPDLQTPKTEKKK